MAALEQIFRYPIKGLTPESLLSARAVPGHGLEGDRRFGLKFLDAPEGWARKTWFATLLNYPALAALRVECDLAGHRLRISQGGHRLLDAHTDRDRSALSAFFTDFLRRPENAHPAHPGRAVQFVGDDASRFPDRNTVEISLAGRATLNQVSERFMARRGPAGPPGGGGVPALATERFRINLIVAGDDVAPWAEFDWLGREAQIGQVRLKLTAKIGRCATTHVNPLTGVCDADVVGMLGEEFGHKHLGVLGVIVQGGTLAVNDPVLVR